MGLSNAVSGGIILFGITSVMFTFASLIDTSVSINEVLFERTELENKLLKTSIEITIPDPPGTDNIFDFRMENTNLEKLWDFENFDVIVTYDSTGTIYTEILTFDSECSASIETWCIDSWISNDNVDPGILNTGEIINIRATLNNNLDSSSDLTITVSTPNGVVSTINRTV